jgi:hypothetical protein
MLGIQPRHKENPTSARHKTKEQVDFMVKVFMEVNRKPTDEQIWEVAEETQLQRSSVLVSSINF